MKFMTTIALLWGLQLHAQIGIGTVNPSANAALDVNSTDKGLMLPRLADTTNISNPSAGLVIFNMQTKGLAFHNGNRWHSLSTNNATATVDSITYFIIYGTGGFSNRAHLLTAISNGIARPGDVANLINIELTKPLDDNSIAISKAVAAPFTGPGSSNYIEIKSYTPGSATPNFSIKIKDPKFVSYKVSIGSDLQEYISITGAIIGYKNWITNTSFGYNLLSGVLVNY